MKTCVRERAIIETNKQTQKSIKFWNQIIRYVTTEKTIFSRDGNVCIARDNRTKCLSDWHIFYSTTDLDCASHRLLIWIMIPRWKGKKVFFSLMNHWILGKSFSFLGLLSVTTHHWLNKRTLKTKVLSLLY